MTEISVSYSKLKEDSTPYKTNTLSRYFGLCITGEEVRRNGLEKVFVSFFHLILSGTSV